MSAKVKYTDEPLRSWLWAKGVTHFQRRKRPHRAWRERNAHVYALGTNVENLILTGATAINGTGNDANNALTGNSAANVLDGGGGTDRLKGGQGDDTYIVDDTTVVVAELLDEGTDRVQSSINYTAGANVENLTLIGGSGLTATGKSLNLYTDGRVLTRDFWS